MFNTNLTKIVFIFLCLLFCEIRQIKSQSAPICQGDSAVLRINCSYLGTLQWQSSSNQATWSTITGATFDTLKVIPSLTTYYRASITSGTCNLVYSDTAVITVNTIPPAPSITIADSCGSSRLTAGNYSSTLLWSTGQTVNPITVNSAGTYTVSQTLNGCISNVSSSTASPIAIPSAPTTGTHTASQTQIVWNWNTVTGASGYKYNTVNNYSTATDNLGNLSYTQTGLTCNTIYTLYVWAYNGCGNSAVVTLTRSSSDCCSIPDAPTVAGTSTCIGSSVTLTASAPGGTYQWYDAPSGGTLLYTGASYTTPVLSANTTYYVQTTVSGCTSARTTVSVTVSSAGPPATPGAITGPSPVTSGSTGYVYSISPVAGATTYTWTVPPCATITVGQGTTSITVTYSSAPSLIFITSGSYTCNCITAANMTIIGGGGGGGNNGYGGGGGGGYSSGTFSGLSGASLAVTVGDGGLTGWGGAVGGTSSVDALISATGGGGGFQSGGNGFGGAGGVGSGGSINRTGGNGGNSQYTYLGGGGGGAAGSISNGSNGGPPPIFYPTAGWDGPTNYGPGGAGGGGNAGNGGSGSCFNTYPTNIAATAPTNYGGGGGGGNGNSGSSSAGAGGYVELSAVTYGGIISVTANNTCGNSAASTKTITLNP